MIALSMYNPCTTIENQRTKTIIITKQCVVAGKGKINKYEFNKSYLYIPLLQKYKCM